MSPGPGGSPGDDARRGGRAGGRREEGRERPPVLVLGYGSELRRDDAAGRIVAEALAERALPGVEARPLHQLTPEVAEDLSGRTVVFVDATVTREAVDVVALEPGDGRGPMTHHVDPRGLLDLAASLDGPATAAWVVHIPAHDLGLGTELSARARAGVEEAVEHIVALCEAATG
ncbi:MAG: hydrogenase maturation protease [Actinomycetota bacterium]